MRLWKIYFRKKVDQKKEKIKYSVQKKTSSLHNISSYAKLLFHTSFEKCPARKKEKYRAD